MTSFSLCVILAVVCCLASAHPPTQRGPSQGGPSKGGSSHGPSQGRPSEDRPSQGKPSQGRPSQGRPSQGAPSKGGCSHGPSQGGPSHGAPPNRKPCQPKPKPQPHKPCQRPSTTTTAQPITSTTTNSPIDEGTTATQPAENITSTTPPSESTTTPEPVEDEPTTPSSDESESEEAETKADFDGLRNITIIFKNTTAALYRDAPKDLKCECWESLDFLADQITNLVAEMSRIFEESEDSVITHDLLHWFHNTQNSARHLATDVWQSDKVKDALLQIADYSVNLQQELTPYENKSAPEEFMDKLDEILDFYINQIELLNEGVREYW